MTGRGEPEVTIACLHQPNFLPWTKLISKIAASDVWIVYDSVQYTKTEFHSRQLINTRQGPMLLSVPVLRAGRPRFQTLADVELCDDHNWRAAHLRQLTEHYRRTPYWSEVYALLEPVYYAGHRHLVDFNLDLAQAIMRYVGVRTTVVRASSLSHQGDRTDRLIQLNQAVGAEVHLTGTYNSDRVDIDWDRVAQAGISVCEHQFTHPIYPQPSKPFVANLSIVDMLSNCGPDAFDDLAQRRQNPVVLRGAPRRYDRSASSPA